MNYAEYINPKYWDNRTPFLLNMPKFIHLYQDLNDYPIRKFLSSLKGSTLDIGTGEGRFLPYASLGVDFSKGMLERAKVKNKPLIRASVLYLPFQNDVFTSAFTVDVLCHIEPCNHEYAIAEMCRVASTVYFFIDRTMLNFFLVHMIPIRPRRLTAFLAVCLAFFFDRLKKIRIVGLNHGSLGKFT